ncbi:MAG: hypothetical protein ACK5M4_01760 [Pseudorhodobacter sp.]
MELAGCHLVGDWKEAAREMLDSPETEVISVIDSTRCTIRIVFCEKNRLLAAPLAGMARGESVQ